MIEEYQFQKWGSISRLFRPILITEKIDGTNAQIVVADRETVEFSDDFETQNLPWIYQDDFALLAGSRKRYLTHEADNFGFHKWVVDNAGALVYLGEGKHYGEWWGSKIQRGYGMKHKCFSLFNVMRYNLDPSLYKPVWDIGVKVVPLLYAGDWEPRIPEELLMKLEVDGSFAAPGFDKPEGIVIYHTHSRALFKVTLHGDQHKSQTMNDKLEVLNERMD